MHNQYAQGKSIRLELGYDRIQNINLTFSHLLNALQEPVQIVQTILEQIWLEYLAQIS